MESLEIDSTGNPFITMFPEAVAFKAEFAISQGFDRSQIMEEVSLRKSILEDNEIEVFLYPSPKKIKTSIAIFQALAELTAILAFAKNGIQMFGYHYEVLDSKLEINKVEGYARE